MAVLCFSHSYSYSDGHVLHHFTLQRSCLLQSGALPGRYGFLFLFLPPSAPLESSSAGSLSRLESDFASQSRSSASIKGERTDDEWQPCGREHPSQVPQHRARVNSIWTQLSGRTLTWLKLGSPVPLQRTFISGETLSVSYTWYCMGMWEHTKNITTNWAYSDINHLYHSRANFFSTDSKNKTSLQLWLVLKSAAKIGSAQQFHLLISKLTENAIKWTNSCTFGRITKKSQHWQSKPSKNILRWKKKPSLEDKYLCCPPCLHHESALRGGLQEPEALPHCSG